MNFTDYISSLQKKYGCSSLEELFEKLGGSQALKIKAPTLRAIQQGRHTPSIDLFARLFKQADGPDRKKLILGYFKTLLAAETYPTRSPEERDDRDKQIADELLEYLEVNLAESSMKRTKPLWDTGEPFMQYTEEQLNLMLSNERIWRFFKKVVLFDQIPTKDCDLPKTDLDKLKEAELIKEENGQLIPFAKNYRIPSYKHGSPPKLARKGTEYSVNQMNLYISYEGGPHQFEAAQTVMVTKENAEKIKNQFETMKNWIYSIGERTTKPEHVPVFSFLFCKLMRREEL